MRIFKSIILISLVSVFFFGCSKDETVDSIIEEKVEEKNEEEELIEEEVSNASPSVFQLISVENNMMNSILSPTFEWEVSIDPDDDNVTYSILLDQNEIPQTEIAVDLMVNNYTLDYALDYFENYSWKIIASDSKGNDTESEVFSFTTRKIGVKLDNSDVGLRHFSSVIEFDSKLFLIGGYGTLNDSPLNYINGIWSSQDGEQWVLETSSPGFIPGPAQSIIVFQNKLFKIGGFSTTGQYSNEIWASLNGKDWVLEKENAEFPADLYHKVLTYNDKLWLFTAGQNEFFNRNVWNSDDGITWQLVIEDIGFDLSIEQEVIVFNDKMWIIVEGSIYSSEDGITWNIELMDAEFMSSDANYEYSIAVFQNRLTLMVSSYSSNVSPSIWTSINGVDWIQEYQELEIPNRIDNSFLTFNNQLIIMLGLNDQGFLGDIWTLD